MNTPGKSRHRYLASAGKMPHDQVLNYLILQIIAMLQICPEPQSSCLLSGNSNTNLLVCLGLEEKIYTMHLGINL